VASSPAGAKPEDVQPGAEPETPAVDDLEKEFLDLHRARRSTSTELYEHEMALRNAALDWGGISRALYNRRVLWNATRPENPCWRGGPIDYVNGARMIPSYAIGSIEARK